MITPWDKWAKKYGASIRATTPSINIKKIEIASMAKFIKPGSSVLEVGCGNGVNIFALNKMIKGLQLYGCDKSEEMLKVAGEEAYKHKINLTLHCYDVTKLAPPTLRSFDVIICDRVLINIKSESLRKEAIHNMLWSLKSKGTLIMIENFQENYAEQNMLRRKIGLKNRHWPPFNHFLKRKELDWMGHSCELIEEKNISSLHDLLVYVVLPKIYPKRNAPGKWFYDHPIVNTLTDLIIKGGWSNDLNEEIGQNTLLVWEKL